MADKLISSTLSGTYKDDYDASKGFHRLLFNAGRALQARELTQLQTIIQSEISRFGRNIFKEGAAVNPGGPSINARYEFIKLDTGTNQLPEDTSTLIGTEFTGQTSGIKARVLEVVEAVGSDPATLYVQYTDTSAASAGSTAIRMRAAETITNGSDTLSVQTTNTTLNPAIGSGVRFSNGGGDFFAQGHFVYAPAQSILLSKYSSSFTGVVGFKVIQDIVTAEDDNTLYDNSGATLDTTSPGADRLRIRLELVTQDNAAADDDFVFYAYIVNSEIYEEAQPANDYNIPAEMLAVRTYEESGDYIVQPFITTFEDHPSDSTKLKANISPGTAYVRGYRAHVRSDIKLDINKSQTFQEVENQVTSADFGNYVKCSTTTGKDLPAVGDIVNLRSAITYGGSTTGTAVVRYIHDDGDNLRVYLFNIVMTGSNSFRNVRSLGVSTSDYLDTVQENSKTVLYDATKQDLLFKLPYSRPKSLTDISLEVGRRFTGTTNGSGELTLTLTATGETFVNTGDWYAINNASGGQDSSISVSGSGTASATVSGLPVSTSVSIWTKVDKANASVRTKTLTTTTATKTPSSGVVTLSHADIFEITAIKAGTSGGADISHRFEIDYGRYPTHYAPGRLISIGDDYTGNVYVEYSYFSHGTSGDFYAINSYIGQVNYADIPADTLDDGNTINLRDVLDFRPTFNGSSYTNINELPENSDIVRADVTYYQSRKDLIVLDVDAQLSVIQGSPSFEPKYPEVPANTMELFRLQANPFTLSTEDLTLNSVSHKRYTMKDIANLDKRVQDLRELTTLSLLELDTANTNVFDSTGLDRTKSGFLVDNFVDQTSSSTTSVDYRASIDPSNKIMRPTFNPDNIRLMYDSDKSDNVVLKGDNVYLDYTHADYITQDQVSGTENINPFAVVKGAGFLQLSPQSDEWKDVEYTPAKSVTGTTRILTTGSNNLWDEATWNWFGKELLGEGQESSVSLFAGSSVSTSTSNFSTGNSQGFDTTTTTATTTQTARVVDSEVIRKVVGDRVVDVAIIPFMRSRKVFVKAQGLRPNSTYFPFFDGVDVSNWVSEEAFQFSSTDATVYGNTLRNATEHPDGSSELSSNASGEIDFSFVVPCTDNIKFRTGTRELKLLDVNVNDDEVALSRASADFYAAGLLETRQKTIESTRQTTINISHETRLTSNTVRTTTWEDNDPLAQTFYVSDREGVYVTKASVYFSSKDSSVPVQLQIRTVENGIPTSTALPGAVKFLSPASVNVVSTQTQAGVVATPTTFEFDEPVYLAPGNEYAIVLMADTVDYNVYVAETEQFILGSTEKRITRQPSMGSLFKSQNGTTWTPSQKQDLTFELERAVFDTAGGEVILENVDIPSVLLGNNPFSFVSSDATVTVTHPNHGFDVNDTVVISGVDATYAGITAANLNGSRTVTSIDSTGYTFEAGSAASSTEIGGGSDVIATRNILFDTVTPYIQTLMPVGTLIDYDAQLTTGKSLAGVETRYAKDSSYFSFVNMSPVSLNSPRMIANATDEAAELGAGERSATIRLSLTSISDKISPVIDMQRASLTTVGNIIDKQAASTTTGFNVPLNYVAETDANSGSSASKHITRPVTLANDAVGLKIILGANRPSVADFEVYYRVATDGQILKDQDWSLQSAEESVPSDELPYVFRDYTYLPGGEDGSLEPFTQFQVKIVMRSTNSSKVPVFRDLRVIALAD